MHQAPKKQYDFQGLKQVLASGHIETIIRELYPDARDSGDSWRLGNIDGDSGGSFTINKSNGGYIDHANDGVSGDIFNLYAYKKGISKGDTFRELATRFAPFFLEDMPVQQRAVKIEEKKQRAPKPTNRAYNFVPCPPNPPTHADKVYPYKNDAGQIMFYQTRSDFGGKKTFGFLSYCRDRNEWVHKIPYPDNRPLYNHESLAQFPDKPVLVVEGEKCVEAAKRILSWPVVTWVAGSKSVNKTNWNALKGRKVIIWPDRDEPGAKAGLDIRNILVQICPVVTVLPMLGDDGFDIADAIDDGAHREQIESFIWAVMPDGMSQRYFQAPEKMIDETPQVINIQQNNLILSEKMFADSNIPTTQRHVTLWTNLDLTCGNHSGRPIENADNVTRILEQWESFKDAIWYDEFHNKFYTDWNGRRRQWGDIDTLNLLRVVQSYFGLANIKSGTVFDAVRIQGDQNRTNEVLDFMQSLEWDGTKRIDEFFINAYGCIDSPYHRAISKNFLISMVSRVYEPGSKVDNMVIIEGSQGLQKSSSLQALIGKDWFAELDTEVGTKDFYVGLQGKLLIELAEMSSFLKTASRENKRMLSCQVDHFRMPYDRNAKDYPRQGIFVGTTNEDVYLDDDTGNRRYWPFKAFKVDFEYIKENREQLFAEAVARYKNGESWWEVPIEEAMAMQADRNYVDLWSDVVANLLQKSTHKKFIKLSEVLPELGLTAKDLNKPTGRRIIQALKIHGWENKMIPREDLGEKEAACRGWYNPRFPHP